MTFEVDAEAYDRFMGRYSVRLAPQLAEFGGVRAGRRVLDVGCGPGALTGELVRRLGGEAVVAVDPSETFVAAAQARHPTVQVQRASAESLPFDDGVFDAALAQLVVHFMADPVAGLREMARVTRPGGVVAACVWDHAGERSPLASFWQAARELDPRAQDESKLAGAREGHLGELFAEAGLKSVQETTIEASEEFSSFEEWWEPFTLGVGPAGAYAKSLDDAARTRLRDRCRELLAPPPFTVRATAWTTRGLVLGDVPESRLEPTELGLVPTGDGWFVLNAREARWRDGPGLPAFCELEGEPEFSQLGINLSVLAPGEPMAMYHWEADQEDFLVLAGEALLIVEGEERPLRQWDFVHCPAGTKHVIVGAGDAPCLMLAVGARERSTGPDWGCYTVDDAAIRHGAGVEAETTEAEIAYARFARRQPTRYREGWLPGA